MKALESRTSIAFNRYFPKNSIISCFFVFYFYIINLYFLIPAVIRQTFIPTAELLIPTKINEADEKNECNQ